MIKIQIANEKVCRFQDARLDHVRCFSGKLVSFDPWNVTHFGPIGKT